MSFPVLKNAWRFALDATALFLFLVLATGCETNDTADAGAEAVQDVEVLPGEVDRDSTDLYLYVVTYPDGIDARPVMKTTLQRWVESRKQNFVREANRSADYAAPWQMHLRFDVTMDTEVFSSVVAEGYDFTGGTQGTYFYEGFTVEMQRREPVTMEDLFQDSTVYEDLSLYVIEEFGRALEQSASELTEDEYRYLLELLEAGAAPDPENFRVFYLLPAQDGRAAGIGLVFQPGQIAQPVAGRQTVFAPTELFQSKLSPAYRDKFTTDRPL
jgi:hypothetical protein